MGNRAIVSIQKGHERQSYYLHWNGSLDTIAPVSKALFDADAKDFSDFENFMKFLGLRAEKQKDLWPLTYVEENGHFLIVLNAKKLEQYLENGERVYHADLKYSFEEYLQKHIKVEYRENERVEYWQGILKSGTEFFKTKALNEI